jgi:hypothetical protein
VPADVLMMLAGELDDRVRSIGAVKLYSPRLGWTNSHFNWFSGGDRVDLGGQEPPVFLIVR